jgi:hypothetical protein
LSATALLEQGVGAEELKVVIPVATAVAGFLVAFAWNRWWRKRDDRETSGKQTVKDHGNRLVVIEHWRTQVEVREEARQNSVGRLEVEHNKLEGKVVGLQDFWRSEFGKLRQELRDDQAAFRAELRADQSSMETRLTTLMTQHQQRVHDRLNVIASDQARMLTEFVDKLVEKQGE